MSLVEKVGLFFKTGPGVCTLIIKQTGVQCIDFGELGSYPKIYYSKFAKDYFFVQRFNAQNKPTEKR